MMSTLIAEKLQRDEKKSIEVAPGILKTPGVCGGDACIRKMRVPVYSLVEMRQLGCSDEKLIEAHPWLNQTDLNNAWEYYRQHTEEIETAIALNNLD